MDSTNANLGHPSARGQPVTGAPEPASEPHVSKTAGPDAQVYDPPQEGDLNLLNLVNVFLRRWRVVAGVPLLAGVLSAMYAFALPPTFTATTTFLAEVRSESGVPVGLAGLAGQFGISVGRGASQSPQFYAQVMESRDIRVRVLMTQYVDPRGTENPVDSATLLEILEVEGENLAARLHNGMRSLSDLVSVRVDNRTSIVRLNVDGRYPALAAAVANRFVEYLNEFNAETRQSQAGERRKFTKGRIDEAEPELRQAEEELRAFYESNRSWQLSPQLTFEEGRLRRQVDIRQEVYLTLAREYETARIEEVNEAAILTVIDPAVPPQERSKPRRWLFVLVGLMVGGIASVFWAFGAEFADHMRREENHQYQEFEVLIQQPWKEVRQILRAVVSRKRG